MHEQNQDPQMTNEVKIQEIKTPEKSQFRISLEDKYEEMKFRMNMAKVLVSSGLLKAKTQEAGFVMLQAGHEMGLSDMESMQKLMIINGKVSFYGSGLVAQLTGKGVKLSYSNESPDGVTVTAKYNGETFVEIVKRKDPIFDKSEAIKFAPREKMRYYGVGLIAKFYLPHIVGADVVDPEDTNFINVDSKMTDYTDIDLGTKQLDNHSDKHPLIVQMEQFNRIEDLENFYIENKKVITKNLKLVTAYGQIKKSFELE